MNMEELYDRLCMIYLCDIFGVSLTKKVDIKFDSEDKRFSQYGTLKDMVLYLENKGLIISLGDDRFQLVGLRDKVVASFLKGTIKDVFTSEEYVALYLDILLKKCSCYMKYLFDSRGIKFSINSLSEEILLYGLKKYSCAQVFSFIYRNINYSFDTFKKSPEKGSIEVDMPIYAIRCIGFSMKKAQECGWVIQPFNKPRVFKNTIIEEYFFKKLVGVDEFLTKSTELNVHIENNARYKNYPIKKAVARA